MAPCLLTGVLAHVFMVQGVAVTPRERNDRPAHHKAGLFVLALDAFEQTEKSETPSWMNSDSFSKTAIPFVAGTWISLLSLVLILCAHEVYAKRWGPLVEQKSSSILFQIVLLWYWFVWYLQESLILPISLDFSLSMGESATMSGFFISSALFASIGGLFVGKRICPEAPWDQRWARQLMVWGVVIGVLFQALEALVSNTSVHYDLPSRRVAFWLMLLLSYGKEFMFALPYVPLMVMWGKVTPNDQKTFWMILTQCARQGGFLVGPGVFALLSLLVREGQGINPASLMAWLLLSGACLALLTSMLQAAIFPKALEEACESQEEAKRDLDFLSMAQRRSVVFSLTWYSFERQFINASMEVSTVMLLEVSYAWPVEKCGLIFTVISFASLVFSVISQFVVRRCGISEAVLFLSCTLISLFGVFFLFDLGTGPGGLLAADALVYGTALVSNGIAEGWASRAVGPSDSDFSMEIYRAHATSVFCAARFIAPVLTRFLLDSVGRNAYAAMQLSLVSLATLRMYRVVSMVWEAEAKTESDKLSP